MEAVQNLLAPVSVILLCSPNGMGSLSFLRDPYSSLMVSVGTPALVSASPLSPISGGNSTQGSQARSLCPSRDQGHTPTGLHSDVQSLGRKGEEGEGVMRIAKKEEGGSERDRPSSRFQSRQDPGMQGSPSPV